MADPFLEQRGDHLDVEWRSLLGPRAAIRAGLERECAAAQFSVAEFGAARYDAKPLCYHVSAAAT